MTGAAGARIAKLLRTANTQYASEESAQGVRESDQASGRLVDVKKKLGNPHDRKMRMEVRMEL